MMVETVLELVVQSSIVDQTSSLQLPKFHHPTDGQMTTNQLHSIGQIPMLLLPMKTRPMSLEELRPWHKDSANT